MHVGGLNITNIKASLIESESDCNILTRTIYGEARGATDLDKRAVAWVIKNRATAAKAYLEKHKTPHPNFGTGDIKSACVARAQFSCWNESDPNYKMISPKDLFSILDKDTIDGRALKACNAIAQEVISSDEEDPTSGSKHYFMQKRILPYWLFGKTPALTTKAHLYYNDVS